MDSFNRNNRSSVECRNEVSTKKNHLKFLFDRVEVTINDRKKKYKDKAQSLAIAWDSFANFVKESPSESPQPEFESLFLHTLRIVLRPDWNIPDFAITRTHLSFCLQRFIENLNSSKNYPSILQQSRVLDSIVKNPWTHPVLSKICIDEDVDILELLEYFQFENGQVIVVRLETMLGNDCEDIALRLSKSCLLTYNNSDPLELDFTQIELDYITDIYFCSLYKNKKKKDLTTEIKLYELDEGLELLRRYNKNGGVGKGFNNNCKDARVWKCSKGVIELVANTLLANAVLNDDLIGSDTILQDLISEWGVIHRSEEVEDFSPIALEMIRKLVIIAGPSKCIYPFCEFLIENCGCKELYKNYVAKCLIRAVNQNMNEIEQYRVSGEHDKLKSTSEQLAKGFVLISQLFSDHKKIYRECLLTAFSLIPSREGLQNLEAFIDNNSTADNEQPTVTTTEDKILSADQIVPNSPENAADSIPALGGELNERLENVETNKNDVPDIKADVSEKMKDIFEENVKETAPAYYAEVENLNLDESMKSDLNSILRYQRFRTLSWELEWNELKVNCEKFLELFEERGFHEVELKYLDLDYNLFKDVPVNDDEFIGIEKGYEQCVESNWVDSDDEPLSKWAHSSVDTDEDEIKPKKRKKSQEDVRRSKIKKRRLKSKAKLKPVDESSEWKDLTESSNSASDSKMVSKKSRKSSIESSDGEIKIKNKRGKKLRILSTDGSDTNIDSQSENKPPDDMSVPSLNEDNDKTKNKTSLQMLRQFRINMKSEQRFQLSSNDTNVTTKNKTTIESPNHVLQICIPKCDNEIMNGINTNVEDENDELNSDVDNKVKKRKLNDNRPRPRNCVTLQIHNKNGTKQIRVEKEKEEFDYERFLDISSRCEVRLPKSESIDALLANSGLDEELRLLLDSLDATNNLENADNGQLLTSLVPPTSIMCTSSQIVDSSTPVVLENNITAPCASDQVTEDDSFISRVLDFTIPDLKIDPVIIKTKKKRRSSKPPSGRPRGRPRKNIDYSVINGTPQESCTTVKPLENGVQSNSNAQLGGPRKNLTSYLANSYLASYNNITTSSANTYLSNTMSSNYINGNCPSVQQPSAVSNYSPSDNTNNHLNDASPSKFNSFSYNWDPNYTALSFTNTQPNDVLPTCTVSSPVFSNTTYATVSSPSVNNVSPNDIATSSQASLLNSTTQTAPRATQKETNEIEAVEHILGLYRETVHKFPELKHIPAARRRTVDGVKRSRKSKKDCATLDNAQSSFQDKFLDTISTFRPACKLEKHSNVSEASSSQFPIAVNGVIRTSNAERNISVSLANIFPDVDSIPSVVNVNDVGNTQGSNLSWTTSSQSNKNLLNSAGQQQFHSQQATYVHREYVQMCDDYVNHVMPTLTSGASTQNYNGMENRNNNQNLMAQRPQHTFASSQNYNGGSCQLSNQQTNANNFMTTCSQNAGAYPVMNGVQQESVTTNGNEQIPVANVYYENFEKQSNSKMQNMVFVDGNRDLKSLEYLTDDLEDIPCISIRENTEDPYLKSYVAFIENTNTSFPECSEQNEALNNVNFDSDLIGAFYYPEQMATYGSM